MADSSIRVLGVLDVGGDAMNARLQMPDATAWGHAASAVTAAPVAEWQAAVDGAVLRCIAGSSSAAGASSGEANESLLATTAAFLVPKVVSWAPGMNGADPATDLGPALESVGITGEHAEVVTRAWAISAKALVASARKAAAAMLATSGKPGAEPSFLRYHGASVRVARGATAGADGREAFAEAGLHEPVMTVALPPTRDAPNDAAGRAGTQLVLSADAAYALFAEIDKAQRAVDSLFDARGGGDHADPAAA